MTFPPVLDASMITQFKACPKQFWFSHIRRVKSPGLSIHLVAGGAFAKAVEHARTLRYVHGVRDHDTLVREAVAELWRNYPEGVMITDRTRAKAPAPLAEALVGYLDRHKFDHDLLQPLFVHGLPCIEFTFSIPTSVMNPDTGEPILYAGRCDMIGTFQDSVYVVDEKTTGSYGPKWHDNWRMRYQFMGYTWAAAYHGYPVDGFMVRGIHITLSKIEFPMSVLFIPKWKLERWHEQMLRDIKAIADAYRQGNWDYDFSQACTSYGGCGFVTVCDTPDQELALAHNFFEENTWTPLAVAVEPEMIQE